MVKPISFPLAGTHVFVRLKAAFDTADARDFLRDHCVMMVCLEGQGADDAALVIQQTPIVRSIATVQHRIEVVPSSLPSPRCRLRTVFAASQEMIGISCLYGMDKEDVLQKDVRGRIIAAWNASDMQSLKERLQQRPEPGAFSQ